MWSTETFYALCDVLYDSETPSATFFKTSPRSMLFRSFPTEAPPATPPPSAQDFIERDILDEVLDEVEEYLKNQASETKSRGD